MKLKGMLTANECYGRRVISATLVALNINQCVNYLALEAYLISSGVVLKTYMAKLN